MIARLLRILAWLLAALAIAWFVLQAAAGHWLSAALGAVLLLNLQPVVLALEFFVLLPWLNRRDAAPRPSLAQLLRAWWVESLTAHDVFAWQQAFHADRRPDTLSQATHGQRAVILVHGFFCNRGVWNRCVPLLRRHAIAHLALTLEPPFVGIDHHASALDDAIERARRATGVSPLLVCHSMGGLVARAWWRAHGATAAARVHRVITVGTPHQGAFTARLARAANARQMRQGGDWLAQLAAEEGAEGRGRHFTCFYSHCDNIALPASSGTLPGADNRHLVGWPHVAMIYAPQVWDEVLACVRVDAD
jgi:triacylglycerol lipase